MPPHLLALGIVALASLSCIVAQVCCCRWGNLRGIFRSISASFAVGFVVLIIGHLYLPSETRLSLLLPQITFYLCFGYVFFHFNNMGETARRIRLLRELDEAGRGLGYSELIARYGADEIVSRRIGRLLDGYQITKQGERFVLRNVSVSTIAVIMRLLKILVLGKDRHSL